MVFQKFFDRRHRVPGQQDCKRAAKTAYVGNGISLCRVLDRYKMYVPVRDLSVTPHLLLDGIWEPWITRAMASLLRTGMAVADVGANLGYYSIFMADRVGVSGHVYAFEPNTYLAELIERSAIVNGFTNRLTIHPAALSDEDGREMLLVIPGDYMGGGAMWEVQPTPVPNSQSIITRRLDTIDGMEKIELIKIDAEGAEPAIWSGMTGLLNGEVLRTVLIEFTAAHYANPADFVARLMEPGFSLSIIDAKRGIIPITPADLLALPPEIGPMLVLRR
jgi:FkbM family methyltransferase